MPVVPTLDVEKYLDFKSMTHYLKAVSSAAPHLVRAFSIGKSKAGRPILVAEVTNRNLREGRQKPGIWIDGGHQGWHLLGSTACLELLRFLVSGHGRDEFLTDLVDQTVFYIAPRLAPDEMELCLKSGALIPQQAEENKISQLGRQFRVKNNLGGWKPFKRDNRVMVPRNPEDRKGPFYDLFRQLDSERLGQVGPHDFPNCGTTNIPLQLPSTRAVFEFMRSYDNVFAAISTSGPGDRVGLVSNHADLGLLKTLSHRLGELAGLPAAPARSADAHPGDFLGWVSKGLGLLAADCQMWSLKTTAGIKETDLDDPFSAEETEVLQLMRFCEKEFPEGSFVDWKEHEDPILGKGELGGWEWSTTWLNPPSGPYLSNELKKLSRLALGMAAAGPRLQFGEIKEHVVGWGDGNLPLRKITVTLENTGYLPTCPVESGRTLGGSVELKLGSNELVMGEQSSELDELRGSGAIMMRDGLPEQIEKLQLPQQRRHTLTFLVKGSGPIEITATHPIAGTEKKVSKPPQGLRPPSFDGSMPAPSTIPETPVAEDNFEEAFPSFEEIYEPRSTGELPEIPNPTPSMPAPAATPAPARPPAAAQAPAPPPAAAASGEFNIPNPAPAASEARPVTFGSLDEPKPKSSGAFPAKKPSKGRVFGSPPQKQTGGLPMGLSGDIPKAKPAAPPTKDGEFSPLPLVKPTAQSSSSKAFEPLTPDSSETFSGINPAKPTPPPQQPSAPSAPPARLSRMSAPQLLRRQRGGQTPREPFKRS